MVRFGGDALSELDDFKRYVEKGLGNGGEFACMGDWASKLVGAVCRIAGAFHGLIYAHTGNPAAVEVEAETIRGAIKIGHYLVPHAKAAYFVMGSDPAIDLARKVLDWSTSDGRTEFRAPNRMNGTDRIDRPERSHVSLC